MCSATAQTRGVLAPSKLDTTNCLGVITTRKAANPVPPLTAGFLPGSSPPPPPLPPLLLRRVSPFINCPNFIHFLHTLAEIHKRKKKMTPKMVAKFRRSLSFPNHPNHSSKPSKTFHVRSTSLPCRSHPLISQLTDCIADLKSWSSKPNNRTSAWLCDGLTRLETLHEYLDDLLQLPQTHDSLRYHVDWIENLLEDFLRFVDVYGIFQTLVLDLKHEQSAAQVAIRRKDDSKIALYAKAIKKLAKEMGHLVSPLRCIGTYSVRVPDGDAELSEVIGDVKEATVLVSGAIFNGISLPFGSEKSWWMGLRLRKKAKRARVEEEGIHEFREVGTESFWGLRKKGSDEELRMGLKRMHELEECIAEIEVCGERVFRSLINTRVSLLNVLTK